MCMSSHSAAHTLTYTRLSTPVRVHAKWHFYAFSIPDTLHSIKNSLLTIYTCNGKKVIHTLELGRLGTTEAFKSVL